MACPEWATSHAPQLPLPLSSTKVAGTNSPCCHLCLLLNQSQTQPPQTGHTSCPFLADSLLSRGNVEPQVVIMAFQAFTHSSMSPPLFLLLASLLGWEIQLHSELTVASAWNLLSPSTHMSIPQPLCISTCQCSAHHLNPIVPYAPLNRMTFDHKLSFSRGRQASL